MTGRTPSAIDFSFASMERQSLTRVFAGDQRTAHLKRTMSFKVYEEDSSAGAAQSKEEVKCSEKSRALRDLSNVVASFDPPGSMEGMKKAAMKKGLARASLVVSDTNVMKSKEECLERDGGEEHLKSSRISEVASAVFEGFGGDVVSEEEEEEEEEVSETFSDMIRGVMISDSFSNVTTVHQETETLSPVNMHKSLPSEEVVEKCLSPSLSGKEVEKPATPVEATPATPGAGSICDGKCVQPGSDPLEEEPLSDNLFKHAEAFLRSPSVATSAGSPSFSFLDETSPLPEEESYKGGDALPPQDSTTSFFRSQMYLKLPMVERQRMWLEFIRAKKDTNAKNEERRVTAECTFKPSLAPPHGTPNTLSRLSGVFPTVPPEEEPIPFDPGYDRVEVSVHDHLSRHQNVRAKQELSKRTEEKLLRASNWTGKATKPRPFRLGKERLEHKEKRLMRKHARKIRKQQLEAEKRDSAATANTLAAVPEHVAENDDWSDDSSSDERQEEAAQDVVAALKGLIASGKHHDNPHTGPDTPSGNVASSNIDDAVSSSIDNVDSTDDATAGDEEFSISSDSTGEEEELDVGTQHPTQVPMEVFVNSSGSSESAGECSPATSEPVIRPHEGSTPASSPRSDQGQSLVSAEPFTVPSNVGQQCACLAAHQRGVSSSQTTSTDQASLELPTSDLGIESSVHQEMSSSDPFFGYACDLGESISVEKEGWETSPSLLENSHLMETCVSGVPSGVGMASYADESHNSLKKSDESKPMDIPRDLAQSTPKKDSRPISLPPNNSCPVAVNPSHQREVSMDSIPDTMFFELPWHILTRYKATGEALTLPPTTSTSPVNSLLKQRERGRDYNSIRDLLLAPQLLADWSNMNNMSAELSVRKTEGAVARCERKSLEGRISLFVRGLEMAGKKAQYKPELSEYASIVNCAQAQLEPLFLQLQSKPMILASLCHEIFKEGPAQHSHFSWLGNALNEFFVVEAAPKIHRRSFVRIALRIDLYKNRRLCSFSGQRSALFNAACLVCSKHCRIELGDIWATIDFNPNLELKGSLRVENDAEMQKTFGGHVLTAVRRMSHLLSSRLPYQCRSFFAEIRNVVMNELSDTNPMALETIMGGFINLVVLAVLANGPQVGEMDKKRLNIISTCVRHCIALECSHCIRYKGESVDHLILEALQKCSQEIKKAENPLAPSKTLEGKIDSQGNCSTIEFCSPNKQDIQSSIRSATAIETRRREVLLTAADVDTLVKALSQRASAMGVKSGNSLHRILSHLDNRPLDGALSTVRLELDLPSYNTGHLMAEVFSDVISVLGRESEFDGMLTGLGYVKKDFLDSEAYHKAEACTLSRERNQGKSIIEALHSLYSAASRFRERGAAYQSEMRTIDQELRDDLEWCSKYQVYLRNVLESSIFQKSTAKKCNLNKIKRKGFFEGNVLPKGTRLYIHCEGCGFFNLKLKTVEGGPLGFAKKVNLVELMEIDAEKRLRSARSHPRLRVGPVVVNLPALIGYLRKKFVKRVKVESMPLRAHRPGFMAALP